MMGLLELCGDYRAPPLEEGGGGRLRFVAFAVAGAEGGLDEAAIEVEAGDFG